MLSNGKKLGTEAAEAACLPCKLSWSATASTAALAAEAAAVGRSRKQPLLVDSSQATQRSFEATTVEERNNEDRTAEAVKAAREGQTGTGRSRRSSAEKGHNGLSSKVPVAIGERKPSLPSNSLEDTRTPTSPSPSPTRQQQGYDDDGGGSLGQRPAETGWRPPITMGSGTTRRPHCCRKKRISYMRSATCFLTNYVMSMFSRY